ncbi:MAG: class I SAM-dependent methyltransferase [Proteobacteria bacterium]|nr:class I SAM-dependent methyltransferase [Pseudomonadota bacterium]
MTNVDINLIRDTKTADFDYNSIETGYYDRVFRKCAGIQSKWHHQKFAHIRDRIGPATRHLDIACGPGTFIGTIGETVESTGVDVAASQIEYARAAYGSDRKHFDIVQPGKLPYGDSAFDVATCVELLEHLTPAEGQALLLEAKRVIRPGGVLLLSTPDYGGAWPLLEWILNRRGSVSYEDQHITHFTQSRLTSFLEQAGFENVKVERYQFLAPFLAPLGWSFADCFAKIEPRWLTSRLGFLLFATAVSGSADLSQTRRK